MKSSEIIKKINKPVSKGYFSKSKYINRELSWLYFNARCLYQVLRKEKEVPIIEKCNFLSITTSNLDEFISVRLSSVVNKLIKNPGELEISGLTAREEYSMIMEGIHNFKDLQNESYEKLIEKLNKKHNVELCKFKDLTKDEKSYIGKIFYNEIFPLLVPINYDTTKEFPELMSGQTSIVVSIEDLYNNNFQVLSFIPLDRHMKSIYKLPNKHNKNRYILLEDIIYGYLNKIYYGKKILDYGVIKIIREADIELSHNEDIYITDRMRQTLISRRYSPAIFMDVTSNVSKNIQKLLMKIFGIDKKHVYEHSNIINYNALTNINIKDGSYERFEPQYPEELLGEHDMFTAIDNGDILLHHPYESYDPVIKFLEHAALDEDVLSIKQTLYRVSSVNSPVINALCKAAENGKSVTVILEIKARFDEDRNLSMIDKLKTSGVKLVYGTENLKTHCKFITVARKSKKGLKIYSHLATGNYNDKTAKLYTDISYFTSNFKVGRDLSAIFNMLSGFAEPTNNIDKLYFSPHTLRKKLISSINNEIKNAKNGKQAIITIKVNSISDKVMIDKLYDAAKAGVKVIIFCRGICSMKPIHENIIIRSIVGRFLEHSRIFYFFNNKNPEIFISSADLLTRNLDKRFELLIPLKDDDVKNKAMKILSMYYKDTFNSYQMIKTGEYIKLDGDKNIHQLFMDEAIENYKLRSIPKMVKKGKM